MMVKVLIYSSKEIYDTSSFEGRAEADIIAYSIDDFDYKVQKNKYYTSFCPWTSKANLENFGKVSKFMLKRHIEKLEKDENLVLEPN
jgi:hypothetical protein